MLRCLRLCYTGTQDGTIFRVVFYFSCGVVGKVMNGGEAARTLRTSAVRLHHRLRRFAGANALKKIALNVIAQASSIYCRLSQAI